LRHKKGVGSIQRTTYLGGYMTREEMVVAVADLQASMVECIAVLRTTAMALPHTVQTDVELACKQAEVAIEKRAWFIANDCIKAGRDAIADYATQMGIALATAQQKGLDA